MSEFDGFNVFDVGFPFTTSLEEFIATSLGEFKQTTVSTTLKMRDLEDAIKKVTMYEQVFENPYVINELEEP